MPYKCLDNFSFQIRLNDEIILKIVEVIKVLVKRDQHHKKNF